MGQYVDLIKRRIAEAEAKIRSIEEKANLETEIEGKKIAARALTPFLEKDVEALYKKATAKWYEAYTPTMYDPRAESLYGVMQTTRDDGMHFGWKYLDDGLNKPSLSKKHPKIYNIYELVFEHGYHGGWIGSHIPVRSAPIPDMFEAMYKDYMKNVRPTKYGRQFNEIVDQYFDENAYNAVKRKVREKYGSELDWLLQ